MDPHNKLNLTKDDLNIIHISITQAIQSGKNLLPGSSKDNGEKYFNVPLSEKGITVSVRCKIKNQEIVSMEII